MPWTVAKVTTSFPGASERAALAEYRVDELARLSGVTARNIRAYRERGLLDPPRRQGRSAFYGDRHLMQLQTITQLLNKGFTSALIAEIFDLVRSGLDIAESFGIGPSLIEQYRDHDIDPAVPDEILVGIDRLADSASALLQAPPHAPLSLRQVDAFCRRACEHLDGALKRRLSGER